MKYSGSITKIAPALVKIQAELRAIAKDAENPHFHSKYISNDAIVEAVRPVLAKYGCALVQSADGIDGVFYVSSTLVHESGEWVSVGIPLALSKNDPQGAGSGMSYGRRYSASALLSISADGDDDGNAASKPARAQRAPQREPAKAMGVPVMPFGETKGQPLGGHTTPALQKVLKWVRDPLNPDRAVKFKDLDRDISAILNDRTLGLDDDGVVENAIKAEEKFTGSLPF